MLNILFMGTPDFAQESLKSLVENNYKVIGVVTNPDKPKGRGMKLVASPVKEYALEKNIPVYQPIKVRNNKEFIDKIKTLNPDVICVVAYGKILPKEILEIPKYGCINVHASLLPKYRGAAPIQWAVLNGDKETGVTTMYMDVGMDTGDMILKEKVEIGEDETTGELWDIENGTAPREKQSDNFTMAPMLNKEMSKIDWKNKTAQEIKNLVRGLNPIMGAYTFLKGKKIKFWKVDVSNKKLDEIEDVDNLENGTILLADQKEGLFIKTKEGVLKVIEIQGENAKRMSIGDFLRGNSIENLEKFE